MRNEVGKILINMNDVYKFVKKAFTVSVVMTTIMWSVGASVLVAGVANAEESCKTLKAGEVVRSSSAALFTVNGDGELLPWEQGWQGKTWYSAAGASAGTFVEAGYPTITNLSTECFAKYSLRASTPLILGVRPGSHPVYQKDADRYLYPSDNGVVTEITKAAAEMFFGTGVTFREVSTLFVQNNGGKPVGTKITKTSLPPKNMLVANGSKFYVTTDAVGNMKEVDATGLSANGMNKGFAYTLDTAAMAKMTVASGVVSAYDDAYGNTTKGAETKTGGETPAATGDVMVSLASNSPAAGKVVISIDNVVWGRYNLKNSGSTDVKLNSIVIDRKGLGVTGDFTNVTLYDGATKLGSTKTSWNSDGTMTYNIANGWTIKAGATNELKMVAKLGTAGTYNSLGIKSVSLSAGTASGLPVWGNEMNGVDVTVGGVTMTGSGSNATKNIGVNDVTLCKFKLAVNSVEDAKFTSLTLKNKAATNNAADADVKNIYLYAGATKLAGPVNMVSDKITFVLDTPFAIKKSKNQIFTLKGDIVNGNGNTVEYVLDDNTDLSVKGDTYGTNLLVTATAFDAVGDSNTALITIAGSELNVSFSSTAKDSADDVTDLSFGELTFSPGSTDVKITTLILTVDETEGSDTGVSQVDLDNVELVETVGGSTYTGTMTGGGDGDANDETWTFTDEIYLTAGVARTFTFQGDIPATSTAGQGDGDSYKVKMTVNTTNLVAETVPAGDSVSNFSIGSFTGKAVTVGAPKITFNALDMNTGDAVPNDADVIIYKGTIKATADDVRVERLRFEGGHTDAVNVTYTPENMETANWTDLGLYTVDASNNYVKQQNITNANMTYGEIDFDTLDFTVKKGETETFVVKGTVASTVSSSATTVHIQLDTVTAKDTAGDDATIASSTGSGIATTQELEIVRTVTLRTAGILYLTMLNTDVGFDKDRVILAGTGAWVGKLRMRALYEDIKVKDLKLRNPNTDAEDSVKSVCLYKSKSTATDQKIGCTTVDASDIAFFDDINYTIKAGTEDLYIYVETNPMSNAPSGTSDSGDVIEFWVTTTSEDITAEGLNSGTTLTINTNTANNVGEIVFDQDNDGTFSEAADQQGTVSTTNFYVAGSKISKVELVSSYGGETVDTSLQGTGQYTLAILAVTTEAHSNTDANGDALKLVLDEFRFDMSKFNSTTFGTSGTVTATIKRIGGSTTANFTVTEESTSSTITDTTSGKADDWVFDGATTTIGDDAKVDAGQTAYFVVKGTVNALGTATNAINWVQIGLDDLKGTAGAADANNNIDWLDGYSATTNDFDYLLLDTTSITGQKLAAPANN